MTRIAGELFAGRFAIERIAGSGGMGTVYAARDLATEHRVALKLLQAGTHSSGDIERFGREASVLAELEHPGIVSYVAHGAAPDGQRFLAMEWLEGEDLGQRLRRGPLSIRDTISLLRQVSSALAIAHAHGVIHRDLKPSNLFLTFGEIERVKILDFGIARRMAASQVMTRTGLVIGTPEYMAPEQARGDKDITAASDIFSLGCVLYECLTGQPPFGGEHVAAVLVRILLETPVSLLVRRPGIPESLASIIDQMLQKEASQRFADGRALLQAVANLHAPLPMEDELATTLRVGKTESEPSFARDEQELLSVVIASAPGWIQVDGPTADHRTGPGEQAQRRDLLATLGQLGARAEWLLDGALVATLHGLGSATDQITQAARAALLIKERWPDCVVALATGRAALLGNLPVGEAVDLAARLLRTHAEQSAVIQRAGVWLDDLSASLLSRRFALTRHDGIALLKGEDLPADDAYLLLGKPTPCVGRDQELALLEMLLTGSVEESVAQAVLVTARSGVGKSRLCREFLRRVALRDDKILIVRGDGDPMTGGSPYAILRVALRHFLGLSHRDNGSVPSVPSQVAERLRLYLPREDQRTTIAFLGELCGVPFPDDGLAALRAARNDPKIMSDQIAESVISFFGALTAQHPVVFVLEDLHWADALTVKLIAAALRDLAEQPLFFLALARPEVHERFPRIWAGLRMREVSLSGLSKKACERLILAVLGKGISADTVSRIIEQASGNTLFLEELIRAAASGSLEHLPSTLLAILQGRIGQLEPAARRVIRAASIYGSTFWKGGVRALLSSEKSTHDIGHALRQLQDAELVSARPESRLPGEEEYVFRSVLIRESAYGLLTEDDRRVGHRRAAEYLDHAGEDDALALAEHFEKGQLPLQAALYFLKAGLRSFECNDLEESLRRARRGLACSESGQVQAELRTLLTMAHCWRSELEDAYSYSVAAWPLLARGSRWECSVLFHGMWAALVTGHESEFASMADALCQFQPAAADATRDVVLWGSLGASLLTSYGRSALAKELLRRAEDIMKQSPLLRQENDLRGALYMGQSDYIRAVEGNPWQPFVLSQQATQAFADIGDRRDQITAMNRLGQSQGELGDAENGQKTLGEALLLAKRIRVPFAVLQTELHLAALLQSVGTEPALGEAAALAESVLKTPGLSMGYTGWCYGILSAVALHRQQFQQSVRLARKAAPLCVRVPLRRLWVQSVLARALSACGEQSEAVTLAEDLLQALAQLGGGYMEVTVRLAAGQILAQAGQTERADRERIRALQSVILHADQIPDATLRTLYKDSQLKMTQPSSAVG